MKKMTENKKIFVLLLLFVVLFVGIRMPGADSPLHQDEYKWPMIINPELASEVSIPHPPLSQGIYRVAGSVVGYDVDFRFVPLLFGTVNLLLLFFFMNSFFGRREAIISSFIWIFSYFSILASLMVDTDGQIMPFFFLVSLIGYYKLRFSNSKKKALWWSVMLLGMIGGFLVKVSFLIAPFAVLAEFLWSKRHLITKKDLAKYLGYGVLSLGGLVTLLLILKSIVPFFDFSKSFSYWSHFFVAERGWFQTGIQVTKALLYSSPLLVFAPFFGSKKIFSKAHVFIFFLVFAFVLYVVLFDFSIGALDRYLQLLILPLTVLTSLVIGSIRFNENPTYKLYLTSGILIGLGIFILQFFPHSVPSLHPKAAWLTRLVSFKWNFVYPFSGGSGPLGFYVSFLVLGLSWLVSVWALLTSFIKPHLRKALVVFLIPISFIYSGVFTGEYLYGFVNGSAPDLLVGAIEEINNNPEIEMVTVYNDNGGNEVREAGKYRKRLYTDPKFDVVVKVENINKNNEHYFVLDVPRVDPASVYQKYFESCEVEYREVDKKISATIYDCREAPLLTL